MPALKFVGSERRSGERLSPHGDAGGGISRPRLFLAGRAAWAADEFASLALRLELLVEARGRRARLGRVPRRDAANFEALLPAFPLHISV